MRRISIRFTALITVWAALILPFSALGENQRIVIPKLQSEIILDGLSNEPAWAGIAPMSYVMHMPTFGEDPSERTEILIGFDREYLYVAGRMYDSEPEKIQAPTKKRDAMIASTDWFGILLDTFNDNENALGFFTTPTGLRFDVSVFNDAQGEMPLNTSWNTFWDVAVQRTPEGWFAEMRIPLSSLRFQDIDGRVEMGLISWRWISRKNEIDIYPAIPQNWGQWSSWKPSQAQEIEFSGLYSRKPLYITPYFLGGYGLSNELNDEETAYIRDEDPVIETGLDIKYGLTSNLTLDFTVNTDFAQVEADDQQVNLTRFSLFFPEKRLFFQERSSNFEFSLGGPNQLFYSRRIGLYEGRPVRIYGGARIVGRVGGWDLGFLNMQTAAAKDLPSENFGVLRLRKQVLNPYSYVGGILTTRLGRDGSYNVTYGLDGIIRLFGDDYLMVHMAQTYRDDASNGFFSMNPTRAGINWERRSMKGFAYDFGVSRSGRDFDPGIGFQMREDYTRIGNRILYGWTPGKDSFLFTHNIFLNGSVHFRNQDMKAESIEIEPGWEFNTKAGWTLKISPKLFFEDVDEEFSFIDNNDAVVPMGRYTFAGINGQYVSPMGKRLSTVVIWDAGTFYDGWRVSLGLIPQWNLINDLELSGFFQLNQVKFPERGQEFTAPIARLRLLATLSTKFSTSAFIQYNGADDIVLANVRVRFNPREGTDLYLVYNEGTYTKSRGWFPVRPRISDRTLLLKLNYTFTF